MASRPRAASRRSFCRPAKMVLAFAHGTMSSSCPLERGAATCADPCGRSPRRTQAQSEHAPVVEKPCTRKPLNLEASGPDKPRAGFRAGRPWSARKGAATSGPGGTLRVTHPVRAQLRRDAVGKNFGAANCTRSRCFEGLVLGGPHARPCLRSRPLRPPRGSSRGPTWGAARLVNNRGFGCRPGGEGPCLQRRGDLHLGPDWWGPA